VPVGILGTLDPERDFLFSDCSSRIFQKLSKKKVADSPSTQIFLFTIIYVRWDENRVPLSKLEALGAGAFERRNHLFFNEKKPLCAKASYAHF
jgi:hypothetical protein